MAEQLDRVRISAAELRAEAANKPPDAGDSCKENCPTGKKSRRHPDVQRYQRVPGQGRHHRESEEAETAPSDRGTRTSNSQGLNQKTKPKNAKKGVRASGRTECTDAVMSAGERPDGRLKSDGGSAVNCKGDACPQLKTEDPRDKDFGQNDREGLELSGAAKPRKARKPDREFYQPGSRKNVQGKDSGAGNNKEVKGTQETVKLAKPNESSKDGERTPSDAAVDSLASQAEKLSVKGKAKGSDEAGGRKGKTADQERREQGSGTKDEEGEKKRNRRRRGSDKERNQECRRGDDGGVRAERGNQQERTEADRANKAGKEGEMLQNKGRENHRKSDNSSSRAPAREQPDKDSPAQRNVERKASKSNVTAITSKRYSKSDIRRPRNRTYSSSSASSADRTRRPPSASKSDNREKGTTSEGGRRPHLQSWSTNRESSTDSREGSEMSDDKTRTYRKDGASADRRREERHRPKGNKARGRGILRMSLEKQASSSSRGGECHKQVLGPRGRGGGILVLPSRTDISNSPVVGQRLLFGGNRGGATSRTRGGRGGGARRLWDPNNPDQKPALAPSQSSQHQSLQPPVYLQTGTGYGQLHFLDTDDEVSGSPPVHQGDNFRSQQQAATLAYYKFQNSDNPYCYPVPASGPANPGTGPRYPFPYMGPYQIANGVYPGQFCATYRGYSQPGSGLTLEEAELHARGELCLLLRAADSQELQLSNLLSRDRLSADGLERMAQLRVELLGLYERVVLTDIEFADSQNVDQALWKNVFYQVIERFRQLLKDPASDNTPHIRNMLLTLLDEGAQFFDTLLQKLQTVYQFKLDDYMDGMAIRARPLRKTVKYALISAQRCMICQGDIARYREQASDTANYGKARSWYLKAQQIAPKNGRPYNQLALLAVYTKRKLDAVYYYMRSLAASNPILTARESLMSLFEEAKRKTEQLERRRRQEEQEGGSRGPAVRGRARGEEGARSEMWVRPSGHVARAASQRAGSESSRDSEQDGELSSLSANDLNKRFILSFLHAHGKLFTKVGMESFPRVARRVLQEFRALLQHGPSLLGSTHMLQIITINMFIIHNVLSRGDGGESRSLLQEQSTALGLAMFALMVQRCTELLRDVPSAAAAVSEEETESELDGLVKVSDFPADLRELLPSIKVWSDWMLGHPDQWNPPPCSVDCSPDVWQCLASLCNVLARVDHGEAPLYKADTEDGEGDEELRVLQLKEDRLLAGFVPLLAAPQEPCYVDRHADTAMAADCKRVTVLKYFLEALCGQEEPLLAFKGGKYVSVAPPPSNSSVDVKTRQDSLSDKETDDVIVEAESSLSASDGEDEEAGDSESDIRRLKARRHVLANKVAQEQKRRDKIQAVLQTSGQLQLEVRPLFLVPDTNGFIDHLAALQRLLQCGTYIIVVPLIVITELDGLAKGQEPFGGGQGHGNSNSNVSAAHVRAVQEKARLAVMFLEQGFEAREPRLRALTSRGNQLESIAFRSEDTSGQQGNNDDVILSCCLHYCKDKAKDFTPDQRNGTVRLHREVVLLTDDRNLRVKALTRNVPVRDIPAFLSWAKVG